MMVPDGFYGDSGARITIDTDRIIRVIREIRLSEQSADPGSGATLNRVPLGCSTGVPRKK
ncbi:MAG: hypothetical protein JRJ29_07620 [Deltaproteobacteria bacterium]|nr:hypothetical protein [Deltaproteobacteria bacterium]